MHKIDDEMHTNIDDDMHKIDRRGVRGGGRVHERRSNYFVHL